MQVELVLIPVAVTRGTDRLGRPTAFLAAKGPSRAGAMSEDSSNERQAISHQHAQRVVAVSERP